MDVVLVDGAGRPTGLMGRAEAHAGDGRRHLAFAALVIDGEGRLVLARRARSKPLWPLVWDLGVASHPRVGESLVEATERRVLEELRAPGRFAALAAFDYWAQDGERGSEREYCWVMAGRVSGSLNPAAGEVQAWRAVDLAELAQIWEHTPAELCPWAPLALLAAGEWIAAGGGGLDPQVASALAPLGDEGVRTGLEGALARWPGLREWRMPNRQ